MSEMKQYEDVRKLSRSELNKLYDQVVDEGMRSIGGGGFYNTMQTFFTGIDRFNCDLMPSTVEHVGITLITRPRFNFQDSSLMMHRAFAPLLDKRLDSMPFAIRCFMDTKLSRDPAFNAHKAKLIDIRNPFFVPLVNSLQGISGWPDMALDVRTVGPGFHSEDITYPIGFDNWQKTYDLTLSFKDIQHSPLMAIFFYWIMGMDCLTKGDMIAYHDDIDYNRLPYTVSIYKFLFDPTKRHVTRWIKATGCFPKMLPIGSVFNHSPGQVQVQDAGQFSIQFVANKIEVNDYATLNDLNLLVARYNPNIARYIDLPLTGSSNFQGVPWAVYNNASGMIELKWKADPATIGTLQ